MMAELLNRACPVCGRTDSRPFLVKNDLQLVICNSCSMVYINPIRSFMATGEFYDHAGQEYLAPDKLGSDYADIRFERELRLFRSHCQSGSVLDVGCSSGGFLYQLNHRHPGDYQILGTDVSNAPLAHAASMGVPVLKGSFLDQTFDRQFDAVTFWAVMEHLADPKAFLEKAAAILKPGGLCFILVPNLGSLAIKILGKKYRYIFSEHLNYFSPATLRKFLAPRFTVAELRSTHFNPLVIWQDFRGSGREIPRSERAALLKKTNAWKQSPGMLPARLAYRTSEQVIARFLLADNLAVVARKK
jgi:2-polyprenyl-3-methyl-5-hydroxy-6-metoxy-1,4-benzoquinol methylase